MATIEIDRDYGYVILATTAMMVVNFWQMMRIGSLRKKLGVKYPQMYSEKHPEFNCAQRVHQNTLEQLPFIIPALLLGGLRHPCYASIFGFVFVFARVVYSLGYYTGDPSKRMPGVVLSTFGGLLPLTGLAVSTAAGILGWW